jgi:hypothetical protein
VGSRRTVLSSRGTARFRARVRAALRGNRAAQCDSGRKFAPRRAITTARHDSGCGSAPRRTVIARRGAIPADIPVYLYIHLKFQLFWHIPAHSEYSQYLLNMLEFAEIR